MMVKYPPFYNINYKLNYFAADQSKTIFHRDVCALHSVAATFFSALFIPFAFLFFHSFAALILNVMCVHLAHNALAMQVYLL